MPPLSESQSPWDITQALIQDSVPPQHVPVPFTTQPLIPQLCTESSGSWQHLPRSEGTGTFLPSLPVPGGSSRQQYRAFLFQTHLPFTTSPSPELPLAAGSAVPVTPQHRSHAGAAQRRNPPGCFNCLRLITLQRAIMVFVSAQEDLLLEPCSACRPCCKSEILLESRGKRNFSVRLRLYYPESLCVVNKLCHFPVCSFFSRSFVKSLHGWTPQVTLPPLKIDHLLPHFVSYLLTNYLFVL